MNTTKKQKEVEEQHQHTNHHHVANNQYKTVALIDVHAAHALLPWHGVAHSLAARLGGEADHTLELGDVALASVTQALDRQLVHAGCPW